MRRGKAWGALVFQPNYTTSLVDRTERGRDVEAYIIDDADILVRMDMSSKFKHL